MTDEPIKSQEFSRAIDSINASIGALREEFVTMRDDLWRRMDGLDERHNEDVQKKIYEAKEDGIMTGRVISVEARLDRAEQWRLATVAPGLVALLMTLLTWFTGGNK